MPVGQLPGLIVPEWWLDTGVPAFGGAGLIDAAGEKVAMCGRPKVPGGGTKIISTVGFMFGAVTVPALTTLTLSLQDMLGTNAFPDETQDQSVTIATASIVANTWVEVTLGATRSVTTGDRLAVVWEYLNFVATASIVIRNLGAGATQNQECYAALKSGAGPTWAILAAGSLKPNVVLGFTDGTYGTLDGASGVNIFTGISLDTGGSAEVGNRITCRLPGIIDGVWGFLDMDGDVTARVYEALPDLSGETLRTSVTFNKNIRAATTARLLWAPLPVEVVMKPGWVYYIAWNGPTATTATIYEFGVNLAGYLAALSGGAETVQVFRMGVGSGAWTVDPTIRLLSGIHLRGAQYPVRSAGMAG